jgi:hypothetical protein
MLKSLALAGALSLALSSCVIPRAQAFDNGQYKDVPPNIRNWFKSVRSPQGIPCCDISDGRRTVWRAASVPPGGYEVFVDGEWLPVPPEAIVLGANNPTGDSIVWLRADKIVRCFVLAPEG